VVSKNQNNVQWQKQEVIEQPSMYGLVGHVEVESNQTC
jgi:hypothetical protein